jgi:hypothetical protein
VRRNNNCADPFAPGTLELGVPKVLSNCTELPPNLRTVTLTPLPADGAQQSQCAFKMNGVRVYFGPCTSSNPAGVVVYEIPSLGIRAKGMGTGSENVTGPGTGTVVGRVLQTLRRK